MSDEPDTLVKHAQFEGRSFAKQSMSNIAIATNTVTTHHVTKHASVSHSLCRRHSKHTGKRSVAMGHHVFLPPACYHSWEPEYSKLFIREKTQKTMTKDSYQSPLPGFEQAKETVIANEELCPVLIPFNSVHTEKPVIRYKVKPILPTIVRYMRSNDLFPSQRYKLPEPRKASVQIPLIEVSRTDGVLSSLTVKDRLLNRARMSEDPSVVIRRSPRRLTITTLSALTFYT
ncbi:unnamed protein product [Adineta ricciae]|uniref:Uncharacterized protein n=1 Tax=Adineta ricciae TaxID=249248 RepID=A0A816CL76_ADIRI|nr:unnamed protein product [Adineta ricciae]